MFKSLREKLKKSIKIFSKSIDEQGQEEEIEIEEQPEIKEPDEKKPKELAEETSTDKEEQHEKRSFFGKIKDRFTKKEETVEQETKGFPKAEEKADEQKEVEKEKTEQELQDQTQKEAATDPEIKEELEKEQAKTEETQIKEEIDKPTEITTEPEKEQPKETITKIQQEEIITEKAEKKIIEEEPEEISPLEEKIEEPKQEINSEEEAKPEKKGFFQSIKQKISTKKINEKQFEDMFWDLELMLMENNVAVEVIEKIKNDLKEELVEKPLPRKKIEDQVLDALKKSIIDILDFENINFIEEVKKKKPYVICFLGINGSGKTTTIAKIAYMLKDKGLKVVLAAADTFRAAAIDQLQHHGDNLGIKVIRQDYGSDPAAVAYDAIEHAKAKNIDVVLIDTAGRIHSNKNLQAEMKKIIRVSDPDLKIFVGESITGNDCVEQAKQFDEAVGIDAIILSKADIDEKGGAALSVSYVTKKPISYLGTGQEYADIEIFNKDKIISSLGL